MTKIKCSFESCERLSVAKGFCHLHYHRWKRYGDPNINHRERLRLNLILRNFKHGYSKTAEYRIWKGIVKRCCNENDVSFPFYGGRGIGICDQWRASFMEFFKEVGPKPSSKHWIERIHSDGNYEPGNVRWATAKEQQRNRKNNVVLKIGDRHLCIAEWSEITGVPADRIYKRIKAGWSSDKAVFQLKLGARNQ